MEKKSKISTFLPVLTSVSKKGVLSNLLIIKPINAGSISTNGNEFWKVWERCWISIFNCVVSVLLVRDWGFEALKPSPYLIKTDRQFVTL